MSFVKEHCSLCGPTCPDCGHPTMLHGRNGGCNAGGRCLCGWSHSMTVTRPPESVARRRNKGARVGPFRRLDLLKIPCYFCGGEANTIDHLVAKSKGGTNGRNNLVSACALCNTMKSDKGYDEFMEFCRALETATTEKRGLRALERLRRFKEQAVKILAWHAKRIAARPQQVLA